MSPVISPTTGTLVGVSSSSLEQPVKAIAEEIVTSLTTKEIAFDIYNEEWPSQFEGYTDIWIVGGDGTLNRFINQYKHATQPLSLFRAGSGNDLHDMLFKDLSVEEQLTRALTEKVVLVDVGLCNEQLFLVGAGIGFDGAIVYDLLGKKRLAGKASYVPAIIKNLMGYTEKLCEVIVNELLIRQDCFAISVANVKRYAGEYMVAPNASITDGLLDVSIAGKISPLKRIKFLTMLSKGEHLNLPFVNYQQASRVSVHCAIPLHAHLDGEYLKSDWFDIRLAEKKLAFSGTRFE
ncbi:MAG: hypothetical protein EOO89_24540 [Pedobacter sp.]|nr:MAG: hypothetical protein EOO89_24540 [Pedobacter sp.]